MKTNEFAFWLRIEAAVALVLSVLVYRHYGGSWPMLFVWFLLPDLSMLAYFVSPRMGAHAYNFAHSYAVALPLLGLFWWFNGAPPASGWLVWPLHIALDRMMGYGLKSVSGFHFTHLGPIGQKN